MFKEQLHHLDHGLQQQLKFQLDLERIHLHLHIQLAQLAYLVELLEAARIPGLEYLLEQEMP